MDKILTVTDVAEILKVKPITVREMFREQRLRGFKVGKAWRTTEALLQEDINAMAEGRSVDSLPQPGTETSQAPGAPPAQTPKAQKTEKPKNKQKKSKKEDKEAPKGDNDPDTTQQLLF